MPIRVPGRTDGRTDAGYHNIPVFYSKNAGINTLIPRERPIPTCCEKKKKKKQQKKKKKKKKKKNFFFFFHMRIVNRQPSFATLIFGEIVVDGGLYVSFSLSTRLNGSI